MTQIAHDGSLYRLIQLRLTTLIAGCVAFVKRQRDSDREHAHKFRLGNAVIGHAFRNSRLCDRGCSHALAPWKLCDPFGYSVSHTENSVMGQSCSSQNRGSVRPARLHDGETHGGLFWKRGACDRTVPDIAKTKGCPA
jgi:hypothetical protein